MFKMLAIQQFAHMTCHNLGMAFGQQRQNEQKWVEISFWKSMQKQCFVQEQCIVVILMLSF